MTKILYFLLTKSIGLGINLLSFASPTRATKVAYSLFSEPREGRLTRSNLPKILQETERNQFSHNNETFHTYTWKGNDTVILLVHGWESNASRWKKMLPYLKKSGHTIIAIDGPGHGLSSGKEFNIPQYAAFIDIVVRQFNPQYLIGHSLGGKTCLYYQSKYQNNSILKIVTLGAPSDFKIILQNYIKMLSLNKVISKGLEMHYLNRFKLTLEHFSAKTFASKITTKGFIAHDKDDKIVLFEEGKKIASCWKNAAFFETNGLGHSMHDDKLYKRVMAFLLE